MERAEPERPTPPTRNGYPMDPAVAQPTIG